MPKMPTLEDLLSEGIQDLYSAEKQLTKAIPKMMKAANDGDLAQAFQDHLHETETQVSRLEKAAEILGVKPGGKQCKGMKGVIEEGAEALAQSGDPNVLDVAITGAASRVEHYEMAAYNSAIALAEHLGEREIVDLLQESLAEEEAADEKCVKCVKG